MRPDLDVESALVLAGVAVASWMLVGVLRRYAIARGVVDRPQERSSHTSPTPRGGGAGLIVAAMAGFLMQLPSGSTDWRIVLALLAVIPAAVVGWLDDHGSLPVLPRVGAHLLSGLLIVPLALDAGGSMPLSILVAAGWVIATVSAINVVNFMDGIDGLIGLQAVVYGLHLAMLGGMRSAGGILGLALSAASLGFLVWNWTPARIFLGDVGSGALAVLALVAGVLIWRSHRWPFVAVFLPLFPIFLDAAVTLARRVRRREPITQAHRSHLYQRLANDAGWGHARVSLLYGAAAAAGTVAVVISARTRLPLATSLYLAASLLVGALLERSDRRQGPFRTSRT